MNNYMAELKWIKISLNMFDDEKLKLIDAMPDKDTIHYVWIRLLVQAGKTNANGYIYLSENIPYTPEMLSTIFNRPLNSIRFALDTLKNLQMIKVDSSNFIKISNWEKHQNIEGMERVREQNRLRKQKQREREKDNFLLSEPNEEMKQVCAYCDREGNTIDHIIPRSKGGLDVGENKVLACSNCNFSKTDRDLNVFLNEKLLLGELDVEKILSNKKLMKFVGFNGKEFMSRDITFHVTQGHATEEEGEIEVEEDITTATAYKPDSDYINFFNTNIHKITQHELQILRNYVEDGLATEVITLALQEAVEADAKDMRYIRTVLDRWLQHGLKTIGAVEADKVKFKGKKRNQQPKPQGKPSTFNNFEQRTYDFKVLEKKLLGYED